VLVSHGAITLLVDSGPDLREQALRPDRRDQAEMLIEGFLQSPEGRTNPDYNALLQALLLDIRGRMPRARERAASRLQGLLRSRSRKQLMRRLSPERQPQKPWIGTGGYCHGFVGPSPCALPVGKVVCVGRNYAAHAAELGNAVPDKPLLFIKPPSSVVDLSPSLRIPSGWGSVHHETEVAVLLGRELCNARPEDAFAAILGVGVALDLTLRDVQDALKAKGQPWEISKGFDGACALGAFLPMAPGLDLTTLQIRLVVNGRRRQFASSAQMLTPIIDLLCFASRHFTLWPGDVLLTGTPAGVGPLVPGDKLLAEVAGVVSVRSVVV
jgi:2-keto-4-pentenoate hydratase/2-oxohepta-3-ene-1,7-dioic acid hydratase in catechol pathway